MIFGIKNENDKLNDQGTHHSTTAMNCSNFTAT